MSTKKSIARKTGQSRPSFTLVELLIAISIVAMLSATALFTLYGVEEHARIARTRSCVSRINELMMERWESFLTRPIPVRVLPSDVLPGDTPLKVVARKRLHSLREMMRLHLPDRKSDILDSPVVLTQPGSNPPIPLLVSQLISYRNKADRMVKAAKGSGTDWKDDINGWTLAHQGSECLYLILSTIRDGDVSALDYFLESEIGDVDQDGMREILDAWGRPIEFLRWAPGFATTPGPDGAWGKLGVDDDGNGVIDDEMDAGHWDSDDGSEIQPRDSVAYPDPFDPRKMDTRPTFALVPLIYSSGPDGVYDILSDLGTALHYATTSPPNDPYFKQTSTNFQLGRPVDVDDLNNTGTKDGVLQCWDNISNHLVETK